VLARRVLARPPYEYPELLRVVAPTGTRDPLTGFQTHTLEKDEIRNFINVIDQAISLEMDSQGNCVLGVHIATSAISLRKGPVR
jgi:hypothetical protein